MVPWCWWSAGVGAAGAGSGSPPPLTEGVGVTKLCTEACI